MKISLIQIQIQIYLFVKIRTVLRNTFLKIIPGTATTVTLSCLTMPDTKLKEASIPVKLMLLCQNAMATQSKLSPALVHHVVSLITLWRWWVRVQKADDILITWQPSTEGGPNGESGHFVVPLAVMEDCRREPGNATNRLLPTVESSAKEFMNKPICAVTPDLAVSIGPALQLLG